MPSGPSSHYRIAIVGASSLRGKELQQVLEDRHFPASDFVLLDESVAAGTLTAVAGEPTFIRALDKDSFEGARFAFFAGSAADTEHNWETARNSGATVSDLTGALMSNHSASAWIPALASVLPPQRGLGGNGSPQSIVHSSPSAAAI